MAGCLVWRWRSPNEGFSILAGLLLSLPTALIAYLCLVAGAKSFLVLVIVLTPRIFRFARNLLAQAYTALHVEMARARGVSETSILWSHVLPAISPQLLALAAASASMAIGAAIPIEAICDVPGLGPIGLECGDGARSPAAGESDHAGCGRDNRRDGGFGNGT